MTEDEKQQRTERSQKLAREWQQFIAEGCKTGHTNTVRRAVVRAGYQLKSVLDRDQFARDEFELEIDRIVNELGITASWFWRD